MFGHHCKIRLHDADRELLYDTLSASLKTMDEIMNLKEEIQRLRDDVTEQTSVVQSTLTLFSGLQDALATALSDADDNGVDADDLEAFQEIHDTLAANKAALANAAAANTSARNEEPAVEPRNEEPAPVESEGMNNADTSATSDETTSNDPEPGPDAGEQAGGDSDHVS